MLLVGCMRILSSHLYICLRVFVGTRCSHSYLCLPLFISQPSSMFRSPSVVFATFQAPIAPVLSICHRPPVSAFAIVSPRCRHCLPPSVPAPRRLSPSIEIRLSPFITAPTVLQSLWPHYGQIVASVS